jgi:hypothetical protein
MVRHFGMFTFKEGVTDETIEKCFSAMKDMIGRIDGLLDMEYGPYKSDEGLDDGYTHGFIMTFDTFESRDAYLPHPIHEDVKEIVVPNLERFVVFDFEVKKEFALS